MPIHLQNNYHSFKTQFRQDTGLDPNKHVAEFIAYYSARINEMNYQVTQYLATHLLNKLDFISEQLEIKISSDGKVEEKNMS